jgi:hypothetical protein
MYGDSDGNQAKNDMSGYTSNAPGFNSVKPH